ncbi:MAG: plasmid mobilization relaxosome protein MobC [Chryseobacterium sp.]|nr:MAG: plasmid mobilization relaxosome protein MobC [Chryseobacterium sp.]
MKELDTSERPLRSKGGRPVKKVKKDSGIRVRLSKTEYFLIEQKSKQAGMRISDWFRQAAKSAKVSPRLNPEELKIFRILAGMANNLNQLTKLSHEQGLLVFQKKCRVLLDEINEIIAKLFKQ